MSIRLFPLFLLLTTSVSSPLTVEIEDSNTDFLALTSALLQSTASSITVSILRVNASYQLAALGTHDAVTVLCGGCALLIGESVVVVTASSLLLKDCAIRGETAPSPLFAVHGELAVENATLARCNRKAFAVSGTLRISGSRLTNNQNSIITALALGVDILVQNSTFTNNISSLGTLLYVSASSSQTDSTTVILFTECTIQGNIGLSGGSFMYLSISPSLELSPSQLVESRVLRVERCVFGSNPGYMVLATSKAIASVFNNNTFSFLDIPFFVRLLDSSFTVSNSIVSEVKYFVISSYIGGVLTVSETHIDGIKVGPAVFIRNSAPFASGYVQVSNLTIQHPSITAGTFYTSSVYGLGAVIRADGVTVVNGTSLVGACGVYGFGVVSMRRLYLEKVTQLGSLFAVIGVTGSGADLTLRNGTFTAGSLMSAYMSTLSLDRMDMNPGEALFALNPKPHCNVFVAFDSNVTFTNGKFVYPPIANFPAIFLWRSTLRATNLYLPVMYSLLANAFENSDIQLSNTTIDDYNSTTLFSLSYYCTARITNITIRRLRLTASIVSALTYSSVSIHHIVVPSADIQSLVMSSKSTVNISDISIANMRADTLFWYIIASEIYVEDLNVEDSIFDLMQVRRGSISLNRVNMKRISIRRRFIVLVNSAIELNQFTIEDVSAYTVAPLCSATKQSTILLRNVEWSNIRSLEQGLMSIEDSTLTLANSSVQSFDSTFINGFRAKLTIFRSIVQSGGLKNIVSESKAKVTAGFIDCTDCKVNISESHFAQMSGTNGGVISLTSKRTTSMLTIHNSDFGDGFAEGDGGFIKAVETSAVITASKFARGAAARGGAIAFICSANCSLLISNTQFLDNSAIEGGAVKWTTVRPVFTSIVDSNNTAIYGNFEASVAVRTTLLNSNSSVMRGVPGVIVVEPILIGFVDAIGQLVTTDNSSSAELLSQFVVGTSYLIAVNGVANFSSIIIRTVPGTVAPIDVVSASINKSFPDGAISHFTYETRECIIGEVSTSEGCYLCPKNTFSVNPRESECRECPHYATCPGGHFLLLQSGYWRPSESDSDVYLCFSKEACMGGQNSSCAVGYTSHLCLQCSDGYYSGGMTRCYGCEEKYVWITRTTVIAVASLSIWGYLSVKSDSIYQLSLADSGVASIKLLITFLQSQFPLLLVPVDLKPVLTGFHSVTEELLSFGLSSLNVECLHTSLQPVYLKAAIATAAPLLFSATIGAAFAIAKRAKKVMNAFQRWLSASLIFLYILQPYVVSTAMALVACRSIDSTDSLLLADISIRCWKAPHSLYILSLFLPSFVLYVLAFPLLIVWLSVSQRLGVFSRPLAFYRTGLKANLRYWEIASITRKTLLPLILGLMSAVDNILEILLALIVLYLFLEWSIRTAPYIHSLHNRLEAVQSLLGLGSLGMCFYFTSEIPIPEAVLTVLSLSTAVVLVGFVFGVVVSTFLQVCRVKRTCQDDSVSGADSLGGPPPSANPSYHEMIVSTSVYRQET